MGFLDSVGQGSGLCSSREAFLPGRETIVAMSLTPCAILMHGAADISPSSCTEPEYFFFRVKHIRKPGSSFLILGDKHDCQIMTSECPNGRADQLL